MASFREEDDPFEEDIVFDQAGLLTNAAEVNTAIRRVSSGKCALFAKTLGLCGAFFGLGLCIAIPGPTFLSPVTELQADISPISSIYAARTSGYLIGSVIGGFLFDYLNRLFLLFISLLLTAVFITVTPWCHVLWLLEVCMIFLGMTMGFLDTGGNVLCLDLWGRNSGPFMQALHFSFGLGAFVAPLLAAPFLDHPSNIDVLPTTIAATTESFHSPEMRGRRQAEQYENVTEMLLDHNETWLDSTMTSLDNVSINSNHLSGYKEHFIGPFMSGMELSTNNGLETNLPTVKHVSTTPRTPKPKPQKIDTSFYHVKIPPNNDQTTTASATTNIIQTSQSSELTEAEIISEAGMHLSTSSPALTSFTDMGDKTVFKNEEIATVTTVFSSVSNSYSLLADISSTSESFLGSSVLKLLRSNNSVNITRDSYTKENADAREMGHKSVANKFPVQDTKENMQMEEINSYGKNAVGISVGSASTPESSYQSVGTNDYAIKQTSLNKDPKLFVQSITEKSTGDETVSVVEQKEGYEKQSKILPTYSSWTEREEITSFGTLIPKHVHHKPLTYDNDTEIINSFFDIIASRIEKYGFSKVQFTYLMVGLFVFAISLVFLGFLCHNPRDPKSKQEEGQRAKKISNKTLHILLISLMAIFFLFYVGLEVTYGQLVLAFAVHGDLRLAQSTGLVIAIVFWGSFAAMRFASIFFSSGFGPITMLLLNFVFCTLGTILLSSMASHTETALWVGTALLGIGLASVFPTGILWIERYIHVSNKVAATFVIGASLGEMVCPVTVYRLMVNDPAMLMYSAVVINILCILTFIALRWVAHHHGEKYCAASNKGYQLANQDEEEDMIDISPSSSVMAMRRQSFSLEHRALLNGNPHRGP